MALPLTESDKFLLLHALGSPETRDRVSALLDLAGTGNVTGPGTSTDNAIARYDGATGALLQNSGVLINDSNQVINAAGTAAAPSISFSGDLDTGIFQQGSNALGLATSGLERGSISSTGRWTIGTTGTAVTHDFNGGLQMIGVLASDSVDIFRDGSTGILRLQGDDGGTPSAVNIYGSSHATFASQIRLLTTGAERLAISSGNTFIRGALSVDNNTSSTSIVVAQSAFPLRIAATSVASNGLKLYVNSGTDVASIINHFNADLELGANNAIFQTISGAGLVTLGASAGTQTHLINGNFTTTNAQSAQVDWNFYKDANAGDTTNSAQIRIGNSGSNQGVFRMSFTNAAATGSPQSRLSLDPRNNANSSNFNAAQFLMSKVSGADHGMIEMRTANAGTLSTVLTLDQGQNVVIGSAALSTTATDGFIYASTSAGAPTGTPTSFTGRAPIHIDTTNGRFYAYYGGAWHFVALT